MSFLRPIQSLKIINSICSWRFHRENKKQFPLIVATLSLNRKQLHIGGCCWALSWIGDSSSCLSFYITSPRGPSVVRILCAQCFLVLQPWTVVLPEVASLTHGSFLSSKLRFDLNTNYGKMFFQHKAVTSISYTEGKRNMWYSSYYCLTFRILGGVNISIIFYEMLIGISCQRWWGLKIIVQF